MLRDCLHIIIRGQEWHWRYIGALNSSDRTWLCVSSRMSHRSSRKVDKEEEGPVNVIPWYKK
jgi:hypothetical protein